MAKFFYDSYAVLAYLDGNRRYRNYFEREAGSLTILSLMEVYYAVLREYGEAEAEKAYSAAGKYLVEFDDEDVKEAMRRRLQLRRKKLNLSYADALGYTVAVRLGRRFLTGDEEFEILDNVEYVK